jgi:hypothetical protein
MGNLSYRDVQTYSGKRPSGLVGGILATDLYLSDARLATLYASLVCVCGCLISPPGASSEVFKLYVITMRSMLLWSEFGWVLVKVYTSPLPSGLGRINLILVADVPLAVVQWNSLVSPSWLPVLSCVHDIPQIAVSHPARKYGIKRMETVGIRLSLFWASKSSDAVMYG